MPLVSWATLTAIAERREPVFDVAGLGALKQGRQVDCVEGWVIDLLEQLCAAPLPLAAGAQQLDTPALLKARLEELIGEERRCRAQQALRTTADRAEPAASRSTWRASQRCRWLQRL